VRGIDESIEREIQRGLLQADARLFLHLAISFKESTAEHFVNAPRVGELYAVRSRDDEDNMQWYRAKVLTIHGRKVTEELNTLFIANSYIASPGRSES
jgi:hypothetical protein